MKKKILIIDDNRLSLEISRRTLEEAGYEVATAMSGEEGLEGLKNQKVDLIILDLILPGIDGFGFINVCKNNPALKNIPILVLSSRDSQEEIDKAKRMGALDCFVKHKMPFDFIKAYLESMFENKTNGEPKDS